MTYPTFVDEQPPVITLKEYDIASWASTTCVDRRDDGYVVVVMEKPDQVVAKIHSSGNEALDAIFRSAHSDYYQQVKKKEAASKEIK